MFEIALFNIYKTEKNHQKRLKIEKVIREKLRGDKTFETEFREMERTVWSCNYIKGAYTS